MVEIMERRREVEWSPDMELEGCDAEKAAALLLAVAPDRRSQSFDVKEASSPPNGIDVCNGSMPISNGKLHDDDVMKPSGSPTGSRSTYMEISRGVYDAEKCIGQSRLSPRHSPYHGPSAPMTSSPPSMTSSPPRRSSLSGSRMLQLADLATQELLTMDDEDEDCHRRTATYSRKPRSPSNSSSSSSSPSTMSIPLRRPQRSPGLGGGHGDPANVSAGGGSYTGSITPRKHSHDLRQRGPSRRRCYGQEDEFGEQEDGVNVEGYDGERENGMVDMEVYSARGRRNRPRSVSMPEGMERDRARVFSGGYSRGGRIEAIEEEFDGSDGHPGTRSRSGWHSSGGGNCKDKGSGQENAVVGTVEDAEALIALARQRVGWGAETGEGGGGTEEGAAGGGAEGEGGICVSLPHMLSKYADMYNKNGRIGIYTRQEREAIIARFKRKRSRRVWKKKIRYNCRKNLADKRLRVKGRFVKMSPEQRAALKLKQKHKLRNGRVTGGGGGSAGSGSVDMELLASEEMGSGETSSGMANAEGFDMEEAVGVEGDDEVEEEEEGDDDEEDDDDDEVFPEENLKRVRRHSIAY